jgi:hypothetical protein
MSLVFSFVRFGERTGIQNIGYELILLLCVLMVQRKNYSAEILKRFMRALWYGKNH